ncbi:hypothetical protein [Zobellia alginiliquefaciens]|uniref:hypothetical protein n=1 Tax=Zobellia alginiliquefaciens TaxID=3032586 RepID=UPI0023E47270|nr:hypothetical protein [Zobellia alginiliquefaciens]
MEIFNQTDIKKYYQIFGYANLIFSILLVIFLTDIDFKERIFALISINVGFHMLYWFFSSLSKDSTRMNNSFNKIMGTGMLKIFAVFGIICSFTIVYFFITNAISEKEYVGLFGICIPFGLFLGAYKLWTDLNNE